MGIGMGGVFPLSAVTASELEVEYAVSTGEQTEIQSALDSRVIRVAVAFRIPCMLDAPLYPMHARCAPCQAMTTVPLALQWRYVWSAVCPIVGMAMLWVPSGPSPKLAADGPARLSPYSVGMHI